MPNKNKGVKMSLGDFMGGAPSGGVSALPTGPKARGYVIELSGTKSYLHAGPSFSHI